MLLHLLDLYRLDDVFTDYENIRYELTVFSEELAQKEEIIVFSKADLLDDEMRQHIPREFSKRFPNKKYFIISAATGEGLEELKDYLVENVEPITKNVGNAGMRSNESEEHKIYDLRNQEADPKKIYIEYEGDLGFRASGKRLEQIVRMTDFENHEAVMRVYDVLEKMGVMKEVEKKLETILEEK